MKCEKCKYDLYSVAKRITGFGHALMCDACFDGWGEWLEKHGGEASMNDIAEWLMPNLPVPRIELWKRTDDDWFVVVVADPTISVGTAMCHAQPNMSAESCVATWVAATGWAVVHVANGEPTIVSDARPKELSDA